MYLICKVDLYKYILLYMSSVFIYLLPKYYYIICYNNVMYFVFVKSICWILFVLYNKLNFYYYLIKCLLRNCNFDVKMIGLDLTNRER